MSYQMIALNNCLPPLTISGQLADDLFQALTRNSVMEPSTEPLTEKPLTEGPALPAAAAKLSEAASIAIAQQLKWLKVQVPFDEATTAPVATGYVCQGTGTPVVLLHGFDSSLFEFRRLIPLLAESCQVWAIDLLGFGFCDRVGEPSRTSVEAPNRAVMNRVDPAIIKQHLRAFCQQVIGQPVVLVGASMGGGVAIDFATTYPEAVKQIVLIDAVGFAAGPAVGKLMVSPLDKWATNFLRNAKVRRKISQKAYYNQALVTADAELCASLHLFMPNWQEALITFTKSGGYNFLKPKIAQIKQSALVLWGRQDNILGTKDATRFEQEIEQCQLIWIEECGHVPHLEQARITAKHIVDFL
jgi:pimeloyl-ACP methyl ester carboxylesterase